MFSPTTPKVNFCKNAEMKLTKAAMNIYRHHEFAKPTIVDLSGFISPNNILVIKTPNTGKTHPFTPETQIPIITLITGLL
jgi:hypothetical protein